MDYAVSSNTRKKVKVCDPSKLKTIKTLFDDKLLEINSEINKEDIIRIFSEYIKDEQVFENFKKIVENLKEETFSSVRKRIKSQYKKTHKYISKIVEEEKFLKDSETKIVKENKSIELEKSVEAKMTSLKQLISKQSETVGRIKNFYYEKINNFFDSNNLNINHQNSENIIIQKRDENDQIRNVSLPQVIEYFIDLHDRQAKEIIEETFNHYRQTQIMQKQVMEEYLQVEKNMIEQEQILENLKKTKSNREKKLISCGILF